MFSRAIRTAARMRFPEARAQRSAALSSGPMDPRSTAELKSRYTDIARKRDEELRNDHHKLKNNFPAHSMPPGKSTIDDDETNRKRLIYRSKQRGWLEVDLLLGSFATKHVPEFTSQGKSPLTFCLPIITCLKHLLLLYINIRTLSLRAPLGHRVHKTSGCFKMFASKFECYVFAFIS